MAGRHRSKCENCKEFFRPDPRSRDRQRYCSEPLCKAASKAASQARWLAKPKNRDYFRGPTHRVRNRDWRARHPDYWRTYRTAKKETSTAQAIDSTGKNPERAKKDVLMAQPPVLIGLIAKFVGAQQDDIERATSHLVRLGEDIQAGKGRPAEPP
jgi:hypothetical protein